MNFILERRKNLFADNILICADLHNIFFPFILYNQLICVYFYYRLIK
jgi:hypothetical protein